MHFAYYVLRYAGGNFSPVPCRPLADFKPRPYGLRRRYVRTPALPAAGPVAPGPPLCPCFCLQRYIIFFKYAKKIQRNFQEIFDFVDIQRVVKGHFSGFSVVKRFNGIILYIGDLRPWRSPCPVSCRIPDKARTILNRFISAARTPGGMIDRTRSGKRN